jgi:hypothetical protein
VRPYLVEVLVAGTSKQGREIVWCTPARAKELLAERREPEWALGLAAVVDEAVERLRRAA